jgi:hypothetical protein
MTQAPFTIEGPDDDGNVWLDVHRDRLYFKADQATVKLGPKDQVAETLSQWLGSIDYEERV